MSHNIMKISIVIPTFNSSDTIRLSLNSAISQSLKPYEIIIVDDCSTDNTKIICKEVLKATTVKYKIISMKKRGGPSRARNAGWSAVSGDWVAFLDADDIWSTLKLEIVSRFIDEKTILLAHDYSEKKLSNNQLTIMCLILKN